MRGAHNHRIAARLLAGAALALVLAGPDRAMAEQSGVARAAGVEQGRLAAVPVARQSGPETPQGEPSSSAQTPPQDAASDQLTALDAADRPVGEKIRDLLATRSDKIFFGKRERTAAEMFYQKRGYAPLWLDKGAENARARVVVARLKEAEADGLDPNDYRTTNLVAGQPPEALAEAELKLTDAVLTFARHLQAGRFPYNRVSSKNIELPQSAPEPADVLARISDAPDAAEALNGFSPQNEPYRKLKAMLARMRGKTGAPSGEIAGGPVLTHDRGHPIENPRVPALREKLKVSGDASDLRYDTSLADAVKRFQRTHDLPATGNLDARTVAELNGPTHGGQIDLVVANMERWRWYPRDLGKAHVLVNEPDYTLRVINEGAEVWTTRVVIGKPSMQTPLLSETMKYITINPTWNVPPSIVHNEYLPALAQDPTVLRRMGLRVHYGRDGVSISMPPGDNNALGRIRFNFPNRFLVYQHDTPDKYYFGHDVRAESHGCMRVQDPAKYAEVLLNIARPDEHWTADKVKSMFGAAEQDIQIQPTPIWVHLTYQTAFVDDAGKLQVRRDVYGLDSRTLAAIKHERAAVDPAAERRREPDVASTSTSTRRARRRSPAQLLQSVFFGGPSYARPRPPRGIFYR
jgi:L,D-transpeptidase YcbB